MNAPLGRLHLAQGAVMRVLNSAQAGQSVPLPCNRDVEISTRDGADLLLQSQTETALSIRLTQDCAQISVVAGSIRLLDRDLQVGATALLPPFTPILLGEVGLAFGDEENSRWQDAQRLFSVISGSEEQETPARDNSSWIAPAIAAGACLTLLAASCASLLLWKPSGPPDEAMAIRQALAKAGFNSVHLSAADGQPWALSGLLPSDAEAARLLTLARVNQWPVRSRVRTLDHAPGERAGPPGLGKTIVSVRPGPGGYFLIQDGTRYFPGAVLPDGRTLTAIHDRDIELSDRGVATRLDLDPEGRLP